MLKEIIMANWWIETINTVVGNGLTVLIENGRCKGLQEII